jgi:hypothetical protein
VACASCSPFLDGVHSRLSRKVQGKKWKLKRTLDGLGCCDSSEAGIGNWAIGLLPKQQGVR